MSTYNNVSVAGTKGENTVWSCAAWYECCKSQRNVREFY